MTVPFLAVFERGRLAGIREAAAACGNSGDYYIERAESWLLDRFALEPAQAAEPRFDEEKPGREASES